MWLRQKEGGKGKVDKLLGKYVGVMEEYFVISAELAVTNKYSSTGAKYQGRY